MSTITVRRSMTLALLALGTALASACDPALAAGPDRTGTEGVSVIGTAGPTTAGPTIVAPATSTGPGLIVEPPEIFGYPYPNTAQGYAEQVMQAWAAGDGNRLWLLTTEAAYHGIVDLNASPNDEWTLLRCDGTAGSSYCSYTNPDGDLLTLRISHQLLGQAHATTDVTLEKTVYPKDPVLYVKEFIKAWQFGNTARMLKLSSPAVVDKVPDTAPTSVTYLPLDCCGGGLAQVKVKIGNATARFDVGTIKLGGPNAILDYVVKFGITS